MYRFEDYKKIFKVLLVALLCNEMQSNFLLQSSKIGAFHPYAYAAELNAMYATTENSKFHASIRLTTLDDNFGEGHICSGSLIAPSVVLTAGQCVYDYVKNNQRHPAEFKVVMGTQNRYQRTQHTLAYGVTHLYTPVTFNPVTLRDNIAILMLERDIFENEHIKPITLKSEDTKSNNEISEDFKVTSYLKTQEGVALPPLMLLNASSVNHIFCHQSFDVICLNFLSLSSDLCPFDLGAPLIVQDQLIGLSSHVNDCQIESLPAIYSNLRRHKAWIMKTIGNGTNKNSSILGTLSFLLFTAFAIKTANFKKLRSLVNS